jgi:hypothetical protein
LLPTSYATVFPEARTWQEVEGHLYRSLFRNDRGRRRGLEAVCGRASGHRRGAESSRRVDASVNAGTLKVMMIPGGIVGRTAVQRNQVPSNGVEPVGRSQRNYM